MSAVRQGALGAASLLILLLVFPLWPSAIGGSSSYVSTRGSSMEPHFRQGDLVVVRAAGSYDIGDVVAYRSGTLGGVIVLHRIVDRDAKGFITQGDNNDFFDPDRPDATTILGREWAHIPSAGPLLGASKISLPLLVGGVMLLGKRKIATRRGNRRPAHAAKPARPARPANPSSVQTWRNTTLACGAVGIVALAFGFVSYTRPAAEATTDELRYTQRGVFSYSASAPAGPVYGDGRVDTGDPVFLNVVDDLDVTFEYDFESGAQQTLSGTMAVRAELSNASGWRHQIELQAPAPFQDDDVRADVHLDIREVQRLAAEVAWTTGIAGGATTVAIVPVAELSGTLDANRIEETFSPALEFKLEPLQLQLQAGDDETSLAPSTAGVLTITTETPRLLTAFGQSLPVTTGRALSLGLGAPAVVVAAVGLLVLRRRLQGEAARIELRHGHRMVPVTGRAERSQVIEVRSIQDLARMAEQYQSLILHREGAHGHDYELPLDGVLYRYSTQEDRTPPSRLLG